MKEQTISDGLARKFLLGQLSPEEQSRIEALAFADPDVFLFLQAAEDDLVDDSLYDEFSADEKQAFENHFLTQLDRRRDLRIARALKRHLAEDRKPLPLVPNQGIDSGYNASFLRRFGLGALTRRLVVAAILIAMFGSILLVIRFRQNQGPPLRAEQQQSPTAPTPSASATVTPVSTRPTPAQKETQIKPSPSPRQPTAPLYAIVLAPGAPVRSEGEGKILPLPAGSVQFELPVIDETSFPSYQALLQRNEQTIFSWSNLHTQELTSGMGVQIILRPELLQKSQRYRILLNGVSSTGRSRQLHAYHFQVAD